jgi:hypothetical protein
MTGQVSTQPMMMTTSASYHVIRKWFQELDGKVKTECSTAVITA